jgi:hypothetical protein
VRGLDRTLGFHEQQQHLQRQLVGEKLARKSAQPLPFGKPGVRTAESILIFCPGEAKGELKKRLNKNNLDKRIAGVETVDKMTDRQIAAKVRQYFPQAASGKGSKKKKN